MKLFLIFLLISLSNALTKNDLIKVDPNSFDTLNIPVYDGTYKTLKYEKQFDQFNCKKLVQKLNSFDSEMKSILLLNCEKLLKIKLQDPLSDFCARTNKSIIKMPNISAYHNEPSSLLLFTYPISAQLFDYNFIIKNLMNKLRSINLKILNFDYYYNLKSDQFLEQFLMFFESDELIEFKSLTKFQYCKFDRINLNLKIYLNKPNILNNYHIVQPKLIDFMTVNDNNDTSYEGPNFFMMNNLMNKFCVLKSINLDKILISDKFHLKEQCLNEVDYTIDNFQRFYSNVNTFNELQSMVNEQGLDLKFTLNDYDRYRNRKFFKIKPILDEEIYRIYCRSFTITFKDDLDNEIECPNYVFEISMRNKFFIHNRYVSYNEEIIDNKTQISPVIIEFV